MRTLLVNVLGWAVLAGHVGYADANTILRVNKNDPSCSNISGAPFCSIQAAINVSQPGDIVGVDGGGVYFETIRIRTDELTVNTQKQLPATINGAIIEGIRVALFDFIVQGGGIVARTLPGSANCTEVTIGFNQVSQSGIQIDHCEDASIINNVVNGGGISVLFSGNAEVVGNNVNAGGFSVFMSRGAILAANVATNNIFSGFNLTASEAQLKRNRAIGNGEDGFRIGLGSFGDLRRNRAIGNRFFGIREIARHAGDPARGRGTYKKNICRGNQLGASSPRRLCKRK